MDGDAHGPSASSAPVTLSLPSLPKSVLELLVANIEGLHLATGVHVYGLGVIAEKNALHGIAGQCPGYVLVGDNGTHGFLVSLSDDLSVYSSELGALVPPFFQFVASSLREWVDSQG
ncbi:hypothetical protein GCM10022198_03250 [Klugiella xanthotipulae]|uniref:SMI1/KNR4 family protein n=2 Tax=Klugiella xanthotipulae TaxID=244735 RepID=A0A543I760_9MICO|nr:hypothetical protein FB466_1219 [Klugiella xanthotipulae]